ncbi:3-methyladenine DNA glycosylase AlkD [Microbacterium sp. SORGH_AS 505]|uniref:DNA alkylation repair protein n=1 Tax=Microbacterium sp. SORGH_AS_0505 TaxID=3041770 RepID=UPI002788950D|nr:DNA alkylation repair protein [Microbacterium sp. SORGH_AS_0505]MDQ1127281.1 3-methyladenine DNA glycosylase AlkD [Microbacterium sp. SORGH_AS_0505]
MSRVDEIRARLRAAADPSRAAGQQAYMKSDLPFLGVRVPDTRRIARAVVAGEPDAAVIIEDAQQLWDVASHREERYAAMMLLAVPPARADLRIVPLIERMVRAGRWWDITDELSGRIRELLEAHPRDGEALVRGWCVSEEMWLRRLAILSQLGRRGQTDLHLLADALRPNLRDGEFFIRKAIGWALRDAARSYPEWVEAYVAAHALSPLSLREALKHL